MPENTSARLTRVLPYAQLAQVALDVAERVIRFFHHDAHGRRYAGTHQLTAQEIAHLNGGGVVAIQDQQGDEWTIKL